MLDTANYFPLVLHWAMTFVVIGLAVAYYWKNMNRAVHPLLWLLTVRQSFAILDFEERRSRFTDFRLLMFLVSQVYAVFVLLFCVNFIFSSRKVIIATNLINFLFTCLGFLIINQDEEFSLSLSFTLLVNNSGTVIFIFLSFGTFLYIIMTLFMNEKYEILVSYHSNHKLQMQYHKILENLNDQIITQNNNGLKYINSLGFETLKQCAQMSDHPIKAYDTVNELQKKINNFESHWES